MHSRCHNCQRVQWLPRTMVMLVWLLGLVPLAAGQTIKADFDNDGFADLAIGAPGESVGDIVGAGAVHILYGRARGLTTTGDQLFHQNSEGLLETAKAGDDFGAALAAGDFNHDGFADLAIGVPGESLEEGLEEIVQAGAVYIVYGSASKLTATENQLFH
jgi:FG-GAP repeat